MGITVLPPDVNDSDSDFTPADGKAIRWPLSAVRNVGEQVVEAIIAARREKGRFTDFFDFCEKVDIGVLNKRVIESLIKAAPSTPWGCPGAACSRSTRSPSTGSRPGGPRRPASSSLFGGRATATRS